MPNNAFERERVALANADYEERRSKDSTQTGATIAKIEREWKLPKNKLVNYRANRVNRKDSGVTILFGNQKGKAL